MPACRLVENDDVRILGEPLGEHHFLLVASRQGRRQAVPGWSIRIFSSRMYRASSASFRRWSRNGPRTRRSRLGKAKLWRTECWRISPCALAVFGQQADAVADRIPRMPNPDGLAVDENPAGIGPVGAEHAAAWSRCGRLRPARQTPAPRPLYALKLTSRTTSPRVRPSTRRPFAAAGRGLLGKLGFERATDHHLDQPLARHRATCVACPHGVRRARPSRGRPPRRSRRDGD